MKNNAQSGGGRWDDDRSLWCAFQRGERLAFECMYVRHIQQLIRYGYRLSDDTQVVKDCIQDLFIELWDSREKLSQVNSIKHYLFQALRYKMIKNLRMDNADDLEGIQHEPDSHNFESQMLSAETERLQSQKLHAALTCLPKRQKEAIYLRYFEEMSNEEVADVMGVNYQSACKFIYTGLKTLKDVMSNKSLLRE